MFQNAMLGLMLSSALLLVSCEGTSQPEDKSIDQPTGDCTSPDGYGDSGSGGQGKGQPVGAPCSSNSDCKAEEFCLFSESAMWNSTALTTCGNDRIAGQCQPRPAECSSNGFAYDVSGCDGAQYDTECHAHQAGTSVLRAYAM